MLILIVLIVIGVAVIAVAAFAILRSPRMSKKTDVGYLDATRAEGEVYEQLYGKRSATVSAPRPVERPPEADVNGAGADGHSPDTRMRPHRQTGARDTHQS